MRKTLLNILILFSFVLYNSNLLFYRHYCGDEVFGSALFHTVTCACGDEVNIHDTNQWIASNDDGCCKETLIYAHNSDNFLFMELLTGIFFLLSAIILTRFLFKIQSIDFLPSLSSFLKRRRKIPIHILIVYHHIRTVVLRN